MSMAFSLTKLSEELISTVASHVRARGDLINLALASRQLHRIVTPALYNDIEIHLGPEYLDYGCLHSLVIGLLERPEFAALVHHLKIRGHCTNSFTPRNEREIDELHPVLKAGIEALAPTGENKRDWAEDTVGWGRDQALIAVLLHIVPNLRTLRMNVPKQPTMPWRWLMRQLSYEPPRALQNLTELALTHLRTNHIDKDYRPFLQLPKLKSVFFYRLAEHLRNDAQTTDMYELENQEYMAKATNLISTRRTAQGRSTPYSIVHLESECAYQDIESVVDIISNCEILHTFAFNVRRQEHQCFYNAIVLALSIHAESLTALHIGDVYDGFRRTADPLSFHELINLKHLKISGYGFLGFTSASDAQSLSDDRMRSRFPASLQELVILSIVDENGESHLLSPLRHYLSAEPLIIPNMNALDIQCYAPEAMYEWLHQPAKQRNVKLRIFRKLDSQGGDRFVTPFVNTIEGRKRDILQVPISRMPPESDSSPEELVLLEEFNPADELLLTSFEEDIVESKTIA